MFVPVAVDLPDIVSPRAAHFDGDVASVRRLFLAQEEDRRRSAHVPLGVAADAVVQRLALVDDLPVVLRHHDAKTHRRKAVFLPELLIPLFVCLPRRRVLLVPDRRNGRVMRPLQVLRKSHVPPRKVILELFRHVDVIKPQSRILVPVLFQIPRQYEHAFADLSERRIAAPPLVSVADPATDRKRLLRRHAAVPHQLQRLQLLLSDASGKQPLHGWLVHPEEGRHGLCPPVERAAVHAALDRVVDDLFASGLCQLLDARVARPQSEVGQKPHCVLPRIVSVQLKELLRRAVSQRRCRDLVYAMYRVIPDPSAYPAVTLRKRLRHGFLRHEPRRVLLFFLAPLPFSPPLLALALCEVVGGLYAALRVV